MLKVLATPEAQAESSPGFLTIRGSRDTLRDVPGQCYSRTTFADLLALVVQPSALPKADALAVIPSTYVEHDGRSHEVQRERGAFGLLVADIDDGGRPLDAIVGAVRAVLGRCHFAAYSTASATAENPKWRVAVELAEPVPGRDYSDYAEAYFVAMAEQGIACDPALARPGQVFYLPNVPPNRRDETGAPIFYAYHIEGGEPLDLAATGIPARVEAERARWAAAQAAAKAEAERRRREREVRRTERGDCGLSPVDDYNAAHTVADALAAAGYTPSPNGRDWRSPLQQGKTYATRDFGEYWISLSTSDRDVGHATRNGWRTGDAFDIYAAFEHGGDFTKAVAAWGARMRERDGVSRMAGPATFSLSNAAGAAEAIHETGCLSAEATPAAAAVAPQSAPKRGRFTLNPWSALTFDPTADRWLVRGLLPADGLAAIYGKPKSYKSFAVFDLGLAVARGCPWAGKTVERGPVVYVAGEGVSGLHKRSEGYRVHHGLRDTEIPFYLVAARPDLGTSQLDRAELTASIKAALAGDKPRLVVLDTLARMIGAGDENGAGMVAFLNNAEALAEDLGCLVIAVHHSGKADGAGMRGSSNLEGGCVAKWRRSTPRRLWRRFSRLQPTRSLRPLHVSRRPAPCLIVGLGGRRRASTCL